MGLLGDGVGDLAAAVADIDAIETGKGIEKAVAVAILDIDARTAGEDAAAGFAARVLAQMGGGMKEALPVPGVELIVRKHQCSPFGNTCSMPVTADIFDVGVG